MFIILSIYSKDTNSLTSFLKFFYKLQRKKSLKLKLYTKQEIKKKNFFFISVLRSPHVNKKSQEQFGFNVYSKQLKIQISQLSKFLFIWKWIKTKLFFDIKIRIDFLLDKNLVINLASKKTDCERFISIISKKKIWSRSKIGPWKLLRKPKRKTPYLTYATKQTLFKLTDIQGEKLLKRRLL